MEEAVGSTGVEQVRKAMERKAVQQTEEVGGRIILQQCLSASLKLRAAEGEVPEILKIGRGMVVHVCFLAKATEETVDKLSKHITSVRLSENDTGRLVSVCDLQGDVLIVPQSTLSGKLKGKMMQYQTCIDKASGEALYRKLCQQVRDIAKEISSGNVKCGEYGTRAVFSMDTDGVYTHIIEV